MCISRKKKSTVYYKTMGTDQIMYCIVALLLGMLLANMLKNVCGCKNVEGFCKESAFACGGSSDDGKECIARDPNDDCPGMKCQEYCSSLDNYDDCGEKVGAKWPCYVQSADKK